jgi:adenine C2-methylase RlmN of 23S rRNA A2503 and tRNA A37
MTHPVPRLPAFPRGLPPIHATHRDALAARFVEWGQPAWRVNQVLDWLYPKRAAGWDEMTNLPRTLREQLAAAFSPSASPPSSNARAPTTPPASSSGASMTAP